MEIEPLRRLVTIEPRRPGPIKLLDLYWALGVTGAATAVYVIANLLPMTPPAGLSVVLFAAAPVCAGFALLVLAGHARVDRDPSLDWFCAGLGVAWLALMLQLVSFPTVSDTGGPLGTSLQSNVALYLVFHLMLAAGAIAGALRVSPSRLLPATVVAAGVVLLVALDVVSFPTLLRSDATFTGFLVALECALMVLLASALALWVVRVGRSAPALSGWAAVALSLSVYEVLLNAIAGERFSAMWWASLSLRVATFAVLAIGSLWSVLSRLAQTESYTQVELDRRERELRSSLEMTNQLLLCAEDLAKAVTPAEVAEVICRDAVEFSGLARASLLVTGRDRELLLLGSMGYDAAMRAEVVQIDWETGHPAPRVLREGEPVFLHDAESIRRRYPAVARTPMRAASTMAALPIRVGNEPVGSLILWDVQPRPLKSLARQVLVGLAAQGGQALARAQGFERQATAAAALQHSLLPAALPQRAALQLAARYVAGERGLSVGGDWYDCLEIDSRRVALVVGDVMGKGLRAAAVMGQLRALLRSLSAIDPSPAAVLTALDYFGASLDTFEIATVAYVLLDVESSIATVARAGHLPPILVPPAGPARLVDEGGSPPLGCPVERRDEASFVVPEGSLLLLYTDGIVEDRATGLDGLEDFVALVHRETARHHDDLDALAEKLLQSASGPQREDDIALLLGRLTGSITLAGGLESVSQ